MLHMPSHHGFHGWHHSNVLQTDGKLMMGMEAAWHPAQQALREHVRGLHVFLRLTETQGRFNLPFHSALDWPHIARKARRNACGPSG